MTTAALQQSEKQFEQAVVDYSKLMGWLSYHALDSRGSEPGFPDRVFVRVPRIVFAELKTEKGELSRAQEIWLAELSAAADTINDLGKNQFAGVEVYVWRPSMWGEIQDVLRVKKQRLCPCGCGPLPASMRSDAKWASPACEKRWKRDHPGQSANRAHSTAIAPPKKSSGLQVSLPKAEVHVAAALLIDPADSGSRDIVNRALSALRASLSPRQRASLEQRSKELGNHFPVDRSFADA